jgi:hypothetical protein
VPGRQPVLRSIECSSFRDEARPRVRATLIDGGRHEFIRVVAEDVIAERPEVVPTGMGWDPVVEVSE